MNKRQRKKQRDRVERIFKRVEKMMSKWRIIPHEGPIETYIDPALIEMLTKTLQEGAGTNEPTAQI